MVAFQKMRKWLRDLDKVPCVACGAKTTDRVNGIPCHVSGCILVAANIGNFIDEMRQYGLDPSGAFGVSKEEARRLFK